MAYISNFFLVQIKFFCIMRVFIANYFSHDLLFLIFVNNFDFNISINKNTVYYKCKIYSFFFLWVLVKLHMRGHCLRVLVESKSR